MGRADSVSRRLRVSRKETSSKALPLRNLVPEGKPTGKPGRDRSLMIGSTGGHDSPSSVVLSQWRRMIPRPALASRSVSKPQPGSGQRNHSEPPSLLLIFPHMEHVLEVYASFVSTTRTPRDLAMLISLVRNAPCWSAIIDLATDRLILRDDPSVLFPVDLTMLETLNLGRRIVS